MKQLTCEMCGSTDLVKQDGVFVCQTCGCKYSIEEAKKMMVEGTVEVTGTVRVDSSEKLKNLYQVARQARDNENNDSAAKNYELILMEDPTSWEASFYSVYCKSMVCTIGGIPSAADSVSNCLRSVFLQISSTHDEETKMKAAQEVADKAIKAATLFVTAAARSHLNLRTDHPAHFVPDFTKRAFAGVNVAYTLGEVCSDIFGEKTWGLAISVSAYNSAKGLLEIFKTAVSPRSFLETAPIHSSVASDADNLIAKCTAKIKVIETNLDEQKARARQAYWVEHAKEKEQLEAEKEKLSSRINQLQQQIESLPENSKIKELQKKIDDLSAQHSSLGLFKGKEKKALQEQIKTTKSELSDVEGRLKVETDKVNPEITSAQSRIKEIDKELNKDR